MGLGHVAGQVIFMLLVFTMRGRWSPRAARRDLDEHERLVEKELAQLRSGNAGSGSPTVGGPIDLPEREVAVPVSHRSRPCTSDRLVRALRTPLRVAGSRP